MTDLETAPGGKPHLVFAIPIDEDHIAEVIMEIPEKEHSL